jgi:hypothetical protein
VLVPKWNHAITTVNLNTPMSDEFFCVFFFCTQKKIVNKVWVSKIPTNIRKPTGKFNYFSVHDNTHRKIKIILSVLLKHTEKIAIILSVIYHAQKNSIADTRFRVGAQTLASAPFIPVNSKCFI